MNPDAFMMASRPTVVMAALGWGFSSLRHCHGTTKSAGNPKERKHALFLRQPAITVTQRSD